ncbi:MAG: hypothetical protein COS84_05695 [Armatimonadetes bacterium CG07_land_8_20_14_0_80_40_9]|nr:MAG: hypothetical protein COS84_05695 [Armatimonadetes bacterium CG07_land_8_20_14_0_80_40_9]
MTEQKTMKEKMEEAKKGGVKMNKKNLTLTLLAFMFLILTGCSTNAKNSQNNKEIAPDIIAKNIYNKDFKLSKFKGKPIVLQFMRTYCGGRLRDETIKQFKQLSNFSSKYYDEKNVKKSKIIFVTVTMSTCATSDLKKIAESNGIKWTFINDYSDYNLDIIQAYSKHLKNLPDPALIFINKKFEVINKSSFCNDKKLKGLIKEIL